MSRSYKPRYGTRCRTWKDTVFRSRSQAEARSKRKRLAHQRARAQEREALRRELRGAS